MEMDPLLERGMSVVWKSGHKGEAEDDATKRRKIHGDGVAELQRLDGKGDGEKMEVDEVREGEVVKKRDLYVESSEQRVGVVFADWLRTAEQKESDKGNGGCEAAKMDPDAECQRTEGECHDSSNVQMEVEDMFLHREVEKKEDHKREAGGEAVKNLEHEKGKMDQTRECEARKMDAKAEERKRRLEEYEQWRKRKEKELEEEMAARDPEELTDFLAFRARSFEQRWNKLNASFFGSFHDKTEIPCMRFTDKPAPGGGKQRDTIQVFSVKVAGISGDLQWPINVFGMIALRDSLDQNRNIIFDRDRDNCQTLTEKDPYLMLIGPVRAVVLCGPVVFEVSLNARGPSKSEDKEISLLAVSFRSHSFPFASIQINECYTSRLTKLEFGLGHIVDSVEATVISVQVIHGSWPDGFHCHFAACTASINKEVVLLDSGDEKLPVAGNEIQLSRRVVSVEANGTLRIFVKASQGHNGLQDEKVFTPQEMGTHFEILNVGDCKLKVTVAWSLFSLHPKLIPSHWLSV